MIHERCEDCGGDGWVCVACGMSEDNCSCDPDDPDYADELETCDSCDGTGYDPLGDDSDLEEGD